MALGAVVDVEGRPVRVAVRLTQRVDTRGYAVLLRGYPSRRDTKQVTDKTALGLNTPLLKASSSAGCSVLQ